MKAALIPFSVVEDHAVFVKLKAIAAPTGIGQTQRCDIERCNVVEEEVIEFVNERSLGFRVTRSSLPLKRAVIRFGLERRGQTTLVATTGQYKLAGGPSGAVFDRQLFRRLYERAFGRLLAGLEAHLEQQQQRVRCSRM